MNRKHFTDCLQISLLILTEFERINFYPYEITIETFVFLMILEEIELHYIAQIHLKLEEKFGLSRFESVYIYIYIYIYIHFLILDCTVPKITKGNRFYKTLIYYYKRICH